jgi:hypothetical protein
MTKEESMDTPIRTGFGSTNASEPSINPSSGSGTCAACGRPLNRGLEEFLGKLGISDDMINNLKNSMQNVDVEEYLNTARDYLRTSGDKAKTFAKENPGKVAAGVAVLAVGAGLLLSALKKE